LKTARQRAADMKLILGATVAVLLAGGLIAIGLIVATNEDDATCGSVLAGEAGRVLDDLAGGPYLLTAGGSCSLWLALDDGDVVAYQVRQPDGCILDIRPHGFVCDGEPVDTAGLAQYSVRAVTRDGEDFYVVDFTARSTTPRT